MKKRYKHTKETIKKMSLRRKARGWIGDKHPNWKGGRIIVDGYVYIYSPSHPNKTKIGYVAEHRLVMEKHIGRILTKKEVVHHIDGNKENNEIENLILYKSTGEHSVKEHVKRDSKGRFSNGK